MQKITKVEITGIKDKKVLRDEIALIPDEAIIHHIGQSTERNSSCSFDEDYSSITYEIYYTIVEEDNESSKKE